MDYLKAHIDEISEDIELESVKLSEIYSYIANLDVEMKDKSVFEQKIVPQLYDLIKNGKINKTVFFMSMLANPRILKTFLKYEESVVKLDLKCSDSISNYVYYKNRHWLFEVVDTIDNHLSYIPQSIHSLLLVLKLVLITNSKSINIEEIHHYLERDYSDVDSFYRMYIENIKIVSKAVKLINNEGVLNNDGDIVKTLSKSSLLDTLSQFICLSHTGVWDDILHLLIENEEFNSKYFTYIRENHLDYTEIEAFTSFKILCTMLSCLIYSQDIILNNVNKDMVTGTFSNLKDMILDIKNRALQIELLENIFALMFLQSNDFWNNTMDNFFCGECEIRLILSLLKSVFEDLRKQYSDRTSNEFSRFVNLNKYVTDGYWRLELLNCIKKDHCSEDRYFVEKKSILQYMLSSPEALINMCLKKNNMEKAIEVVKIFGMEQSALASEIEYSMSITNLRDNLGNLSDKNINQLRAIIDTHLSSCKPLLTVGSFENETEFPSQKAVDAFDILMALPLKYHVLKELIEIVDGEFEGKDLLPSFFHALKPIEDNKSVSEILLSCTSVDISKFDEDSKQYAKLEKFYDSFQAGLKRVDNGILHFIHPLHKLFMEIQEVCLGFKFNNKDQVHYMQRLLKYLKAFYKILMLEQNNTDLISQGREVSLFEIVKHNRVELMSKLIYERNVDGIEFDYTFGKIKLDLTYHIGACSFPKLNLNRKNVKSQSVQLFKPRKDVVSYIRKRNWLLAFIINTIHGIQDEKIDASEVRIRTLGNLMRLKDVQHLKSLFGDNEILTVLHKDFCTFETDKRETPSEEAFNPFFLELPESTDWKRLYQLVSSINETKMDGRISKLRDLILCNLVKSRQEEEFYKYIRFIKNRDIRLQIISEELYYWPDDFCIDVINFECSICDTDDNVLDLKDWRRKIQLYVQVKELFASNSWFEIHEECENDKQSVLDKILKTFNIDILNDFLDVHHLDNELFSKIESDYFVKIFEKTDSHTKIKTLLDNLPQEHFTHTCRRLIKLLKDLKDLLFILDCLKEKYNEDEFNLTNIEISLKMIACFKPDEQQQYLCLMDDPLSILEMLLMNTKLEKLGQTIQAVKSNIKLEEQDGRISVNKIDELLRSYAEKSLDFKLISRPPSSLHSESKIMMSIDSLCLEQKTFVMPEKVPTKEEWIQDDNVTECMCCYQITFSMFNRRHHCRRCGRVICWNCSLHKMLVESYEDILVRVCKDCYKQSRGNASDSDSLRSESSRIDEHWVFTDEAEHNMIVRQEFSYENAPSVLLCLSILKYHSNNELCPRFLLNQCENILNILHPTGTSYEMEIDFNLIINMLKSLAVAAKMISNQCMLQWGASLADKVISQAEILGLLAEKGYLYLLVACCRSQNVKIDTNVLRLVRDKLLDSEQWHLALEVSTKAGLDTAGVFAKWGKSFLKAGNLQLARLKFHMCFEKCSQYDTPDLHESFSSLRSNKSLNQSKLSLLSSNKPAKSPLLLNEIIQILESKTEKINLKTLRNSRTTKILYDSTSSLQSNPNFSVRTEDSISIMNKLQNLNAIANGNFTTLSDTINDTDRVEGPHLENIFYDECIYYLDKYGSHLSLCQFYIRHYEFRQALEYIADSDVNSDEFVEIYMTCLKNGQIGELHGNMIKIDSTLDVWKDHIKHICIYLEKQSMLNSLYQLQQFIGDYVRAAMTCIKFYSHEVTSFEEFHNRVEYLQNAQTHLKQELEQEQWVDVQSVKSFHSNDTYEEKSIANPALVMKLNSKDINKHINTINRQIEVVDFLMLCEKSEKPIIDILADVQLPTNAPNLAQESLMLPTLFGSIYEKMQLAILCIVSGEKVEDGFSIAYRIIQEYKLKAVKIYCQAGRLLAKAKRHSAVPNLVKCIRSGAEKDNILTEMCDEMLSLTARTLGDYNATDKQLEDIIKHISNRTMKINTYIETKQLRSAFLLAAKFSRISDIRRISREAELYNRPDVKKLCQKYLQIHEH